MIKLHLGCGKRDFGPDWIHVDGITAPHIKYHNVVDIGEYGGDVDLIYASHLLQYFDREEAAYVLKCWHLALKPGGTLRIAVPDFTNMCIAVQFKGFKLDDILGPMYGKMWMEDKYIYHKTVYDFESLKKLLESVGFKDVRRYDFRQTEHAQFDDHSKAHLPHDPWAISAGVFTDYHIPISLNIEATK